MLTLSQSIFSVQRSNWRVKISLSKQNRPMWLLHIYQERYEYIGVFLSFLCLFFFVLFFNHLRLCKTKMQVKVLNTKDKELSYYIVRDSPTKIVFFFFFTSLLDEHFLVFTVKKICPSCTFCQRFPAYSILAHETYFRFCDIRF